jgi:hypothetical protein
VSGDRESIPVHYDIGDTHRRATTDSSEAQLWFDRGLGLAYGPPIETVTRSQFEKWAGVIRLRQGSGGAGRDLNSPPLFT